MKNLIVLGRCWRYWAYTACPLLALLTAAQVVSAATDVRFGSGPDANWTDGFNWGNPVSPGQPPARGDGFQFDYMSGFTVQFSSNNDFELTQPSTCETAYE